MGIEDIFRVDWIFIDTIIIIGLIILLITVKIYKNVARWRSSFSNEAITSTKFKKTDIKLNTNSVFIKEWEIIRNVIFKKENSSKHLIVIVRTNHRKKLLHILTEGLVSYGFNVLYIYMEIKPCPNCDPLEKSIKDETRYVVSAIINLMKERDLISNPNYIALTFYKSLLSYTPLITDTRSRGMIVMNPTLNDVNLRNISQILSISNLSSSIFFIFSQKSILYIKNKNLEKFMTKYSEIDKKKLEFHIMDKVRMSFKYYETILLGKIIEFIENSIQKSKSN